MTQPAPTPALLILHDSREAAYAAQVASYLRFFQVPAEAIAVPPPDEPAATAAGQADLRAAAGLLCLASRAALANPAFVALIETALQQGHWLIPCAVDGGLLQPPGAAAESRPEPAANLTARLAALNPVPLAPAQLKTSIAGLAVAIATNWPYAMQHRSLAKKAQRWAENDRPRDVLLVGEALQRARHYLAASRNRRPTPTPALLEYINASEKYYAPTRWIVPGIGAVIALLIVMMVAGAVLGSGSAGGGGEDDDGGRLDHLKSREITLATGSGRRLRSSPNYVISGDDNVSFHNDVKRVVWLPGSDGLLFMSENGKVYRWDLASGERSTVCNLATSSGWAVLSVAAPAGDYLICGQREQVQMVRQPGSQVVGQVDLEYVRLATWNSDGSALLLAGRDVADERSGLLYLWPSGSPLPILIGTSEIDRQIGAGWSPDERQVVWWNEAGAHLWSVAEQATVTRQLVEPGNITSADWHPDGQRIAFGAGQSHSASTPGQILIADASGQTPPQAITVTASVAAVRWLPDDRILARVQSGDLLVIDPAGDILEMLPLSSRVPGEPWRPGYTALDFSPDGERAVALSAEGALAVFETSGPLSPRWLPAPGLAIGEDRARVAWHPNSRHLLATYHEGLAIIWDTQRGGVVYRLVPKGFWNQPSYVGAWQAALLWSPDGRYLAVWGTDHRVRVWEFEDL